MGRDGTLSGLGILEDVLLVVIHRLRLLASILEQTNTHIYPLSYTYLTLPTPPLCHSRCPLSPSPHTHYPHISTYKVTNLTHPPVHPSLPAASPTHATSSPSSSSSFSYSISQSLWCAPQLRHYGYPRAQHHLKLSARPAGLKVEVQTSLQMTEFKNEDLSKFYFTTYERMRDLAKSEGAKEFMDETTLDRMQIVEDGR